MSTLYSIPGIYDAGDSTFSGGMLNSHTSHAMQNANALQSAINTAQANHTGGIVLIPTVDQLGNSGPYYIEPVSGSTIISIPNTETAQPLLICGTGGGVTLRVHEASILFSVNTNAGVTFQDITVRFDASTGTGFSFSGGAGYRLLRLTITDCQYPVIFSATTQAYMSQCFVQYLGSFPGEALTAVEITANAQETWIDQCLIRFNSSTVASDQVGISIGESSATRISNTQVENFLACFEIGPGVGNGVSTQVVFTNVRTATTASMTLNGIALAIGPSVYDAKFIGCHFQAPNQTYIYQAQCIVVDPGSAGNSAIDTLLFRDCSSRQSMDYGLQIKGGQNILVRGGVYSGNNPDSATSAGISITGAASAVQIDSVSCIGSTDGGSDGPQAFGIYITAGTNIQITNANCSGNGNSSQQGIGIFINGSTVAGVQLKGIICNSPVEGVSSTQEYGISVENAADVIISYCMLVNSSAYGLYLSNVSNVTVQSCDLSSNSTGGIYLNGGTSESTNVFIRNCNITGYTFASTIAPSGTLSGIEVTDCAGYNDVKYPVRSSAPASGVTFTPAQWNYFGPVAFYVSAGTAVNVTINSQTLNLGDGAYTLQPGESAAIYYDLLQPAPNFYMFGS